MTNIMQLNIYFMPVAWIAREWVSVPARPIFRSFKSLSPSLRWRHNERDSVLNHRRRDCLLNCLFRRSSKKTSKFRVTGLCEGNPSVIGGSPHKGTVTRKMFPFDDIIMCYIGPRSYWIYLSIHSITFNRYSRVNSWKFHMNVIIDPCVNRNSGSDKFFL